MQLMGSDDSFDEAEDSTSQNKGMGETELSERMMSHVRNLMAIRPARQSHPASCRQSPVVIAYAGEKGHDVARYPNRGASGRSC